MTILVTLFLNGGFEAGFTSYSASAKTGAIWNLNNNQCSSGPFLTWNIGGGPLGKWGVSAFAASDKIPSPSVVPGPYGISGFDNSCNIGYNNGYLWKRFAEGTFCSFSEARIQKRRPEMKRRGSVMTLVLTMVLVTLWIVVSITHAASKIPTTPAEIALYNGADRQQILEEGAKKEGKLTFYSSLTWARQFADAFQKKYPYIKVDVWRASSENIMPRVLEEHKAGKHVADVVEVTQVGGVVMEQLGVLQAIFSPNVAYIEEGAVSKSPRGEVFRAAFRASGVGLGYNTKLITKDQIPKTYRDLLDPKWKGKMAIAGTDTGQYMMEAALDTYGEEFVKQLAKQEFDVHMVSARALLDMIINGEYAMSPSIFDAHVLESKKKGAPVEWIPLEPVHVNLGQIVVPKNSPHPYGAMLFVDFELSKEGAELYKAAGYNSTRKDVPALISFKKHYGAESMDDVKKNQAIFNKLFLKKGE
jgi:iron(III) transport system substrate-binding protein